MLVHVRNLGVRGVNALLLAAEENDPDPAIALKTPSNLIYATNNLAILVSFTQKYGR